MKFCQFQVDMSFGIEDRKMQQSFNNIFQDVWEKDENRNKLLYFTILENSKETYQACLKKIKIVHLSLLKMKGGYLVWL